MKHSIYSTEGVSLTSKLSADLADLTKDIASDKIFILLEENTERFCWELVKDFRKIPESQILVIRSGEENKNLSQVELVWSFLGEQRADRKSVLINVGGGMLTDLGGFAASGFKRGIQFINVPTTLLAMVDASVGGKTGINFRGLKNEIGFIQQPWHVFLYVPFLRTISDENYKSGFAEMLKAALIADARLWDQLKGFNWEEKSEEELSSRLWRSVLIKKEIIDLDPRETGIRKALNFGHTIGHALESLCLQRDHSLFHGYAVAFGMAIETALSNSFAGLSQEEQSDILHTLKTIYGEPPVELKERDLLLNYMRYDKKNERNQINFTLISQIGSFKINNYIAEDQIIGAITQ